MVKRVNVYKIGQLLGEGRYGKVYQAQNQKTNETVAIKIIDKQTFISVKNLEALIMNQIDTLSKIKKSPHIVRFIKILQTQKNLYFVYEFCNTKTLKERTHSKTKLSEEDALGYFRQLISAVKFLFQNGIIHRNIQSNSILIHNGVLKLANFQYSQNANKYRPLIDQSLEFPIYVPPQVLKGGKYNLKSQIWSLGIVLYEMLFGEYIFQENIIYKLMKTSQQQEIPWALDVKVSPETRKLLTSMLIHDPSKRIEWKQLFELVDEKEEEKIELKFQKIHLNQYSD